MPNLLRGESRGALRSAPVLAKLSRYSRQAAGAHGMYSAVPHGVGLPRRRAWIDRNSNPSYSRSTPTTDRYQHGPTWGTRRSRASATSGWGAAFEPRVARNRRVGRQRRIG